MNPAHRQLDHRIRFDWGSTGAGAVVDGADVAVVVDVLSFTTTLSVAVGRGITVLPYRWNDDQAAVYAEERAATLAGPRAAAVSLSPAAMARAVGVERVVLPSPNGSSIAFGLADAGATVVGACLRNAGAVARWLQARAETVAVVAAGERWPDGSLRPCTEDLWGAGAVVAALADVGVTDASPEARVAEAAYRAVRPRLREELLACAGGRELAAAGFEEDVVIAAALDADDVVPVLVGEEFQPAGDG